MLLAKCGDSSVFDPDLNPNPDSKPNPYSNPNPDDPKLTLILSDSFEFALENGKIALRFNPCSPEGVSQTYFSKGGCWIINTEGHITLNLLPVYRYGHPLSIDTKISTNH